MPEYRVKHQQARRQEAAQTAENAPAGMQRQAQRGNAACQRQNQQDTLRAPEMQPVQHAHFEHEERIAGRLRLADPHIEMAGRVRVASDQYQHREQGEGEPRAAGKNHAP